MFPVLVTLYVRLAKREERAVAAELGEAWSRYAENTPRFFPRLRGQRPVTEA
jgi:protein-S-isoprenylcysteine O-methyltransferase Ste14